MSLYTFALVWFAFVSLFFSSIYFSTLIYESSHFEMKSFHWKLFAEVLVVMVCCWLPIQRKMFELLKHTQPSMINFSIKLNSKYSNIFWVRKPKFRYSHTNVWDTYYVQVEQSFKSCTRFKNYWLLFKFILNNKTIFYWIFFGFTGFTNSQFYVSSFIERNSFHRIKDYQVEFHRIFEWENGETKSII